MDQLKDALIKQGHSDTEIQEAISSLGKSPEKLLSNAAEKPEKKKKRKLWKILGIILAVIVLMIILMMTQCNGPAAPVNNSINSTNVSVPPYEGEYTGTVIYEYPAPEEQQQMCGFYYCGKEKMLNGSFDLTIDFKKYNVELPECLPGYGEDILCFEGRVYVNMIRVNSSEPLFNTGPDGVTPFNTIEDFKNMTLGRNSYADLPLYLPSTTPYNESSSIYIFFPNGKFLEMSGVAYIDNGVIILASDSTEPWRSDVFFENETLQEYNALSWNLTKVS